MAACPWCKVVYGGMFSRDYAYCTSPSNPGNKRSGDKCDTGVAFGRCAKGEVIQGIGVKDCPFFKKKTGRK